MALDPREFVPDPKKMVTRQAGTVFETAQVEKLKAELEGSLYAFAKGVLGFSKFSKRLHLDGCNRLQNTKIRRKCFLWPRDHFKTSMMRALYPHILVQSAERNIYRPGHLGTNTRILHAAETQANARNQLNWVRRQFESNTLIRSLWPHAVWGEMRKDTRWNQDAFALPRTEDYPEATMEAIGVGGAIASRHYDIIGKDDMISKEAANSRPTMEAAIEWDDASYALFNDPERDLEFITGTRWAVFDLYQRKLDREGVIWDEAISPADDHLVHFYIRSAIEGGVPIFPELFSLKTLKQIERRNPQLFALNYMNQSAGGSLTDFDMQYLRMWELRGREAWVLPSEYDQLEGRANRDSVLLAQRHPEKVEAPLMRGRQLDGQALREIRLRKYGVTFT